MTVSSHVLRLHAWTERRYVEQLIAGEGLIGEGNALERHPPLQTDPSELCGHSSTGCDKRVEPGVKMGREVGMS